MPRSNIFPPDGSTCKRCNQGLIHWHARGATCAYCGVTYDNGLTTTFDKIQVGDLFVMGGEYESQDDERVWIKTFPHDRDHSFPGWNCCQVEDRSLRGRVSYLCQVVPLTPDQTKVLESKIS